MKKQQQLGMSPGTASHRLVKDILFDFVVKAGHKCHRCGGELTRDTFSIEHKTAWLDSEDPVAAFFDLSNIAFSHMHCNSGASRKPWKKYFTEEERKDGVRKVWRDYQRKVYTPEKRRAKYARSGY
jgi:hypothetical protein